MLKKETENDSDEYYDSIEFTEQDFASMDAATTAVSASGASTSYLQRHLNTSNSSSINASQSSQTQLARESDSPGGPSVVIEYESPSIDSNSDDKPKSTEDKSLYQTYRSSRRRDFSVSDLVAPVWCEVQYDYGLRQRRSQKLADRPAAFVSSAGKEIVVSQTVAKGNDKRLEKGKIVHTRLEREIRPEPVVVQVSVREEYWALKMLDMLACLEDLKSKGACAREMPIFGFVDGYFVNGVIDEICRKAVKNNSEDERAPLKRPLANALLTPETKRRRSQNMGVNKEYANRYSPRSMNILDYITTNPSKSISSSPQQSNTRNTSRPDQIQLFLSDSKTRSTNSLPSFDDTLPSRLQLMLYRRLLLALLDRSTSFDFSSVWKAKDLDSTKHFSSQFISEAGLDSDGNKILCLDHLVQHWEKSVGELGLITARSGSVSPKLTLVYRPRRFKSKKKKAKSKKDSEVQAPRDGDDDGDDDLAAAIQASLLDLYRTKGFGDIEQAYANLDGNATSQVLFANNSEESLNIMQLEQAIQSSLASEAGRPLKTSLESVSNNIESAQKIGAQSTSSSETSRATSPVSSDTENNNIIGTKVFEADDELLDYYLGRVLDFWHSRRPPQGVDIRNTNRCFSCEYMNGCEWREQKAEEAWSKKRSNVQ